LNPSQFNWPEIREGFGGIVVGSVLRSKSFEGMLRLD
jgi:hypothetical protein